MAFPNAASSHHAIRPPHLLPTDVSSAQEGEAAGESLDSATTPKMLALRQLVAYCVEQREQLIVFAER